MLRARPISEALVALSTPPIRPGGASCKTIPNMPYYESVLIARQEIGGSEAESLGERYEALLSEQGATVVRREYWGLRKLAYRVRKNRKGHYVMFHIDGPGSAIQEFERKLRIDEDVIRYLSMRIDSIPEEPSIIMRARLEREERREQESARREAEKETDEGEDGEKTSEDSASNSDSPKTAETDSSDKDSAADASENQDETSDDSSDGDSSDNSEEPSEEPKPEEPSEKTSEENASVEKGEGEKDS